MNFTTINELVGNIKHKMDDIHSILNILLSEYRTASEIIDPSSDPREIYLQQLKDLHSSLADIVDGHPALVVEKLISNNTTHMTRIAEINSLF
jgi:hypothetical protein